MALEPIISVCLKNKCKSLQITDITGVYNVSTNPTGWEDVATVLGSEVQSAIVDITFPDGSTQQVDVTSQIPAPITGDFVFTLVPPTAGGVFPDGEYKIVYTIVTTVGATNPGTYTYNTCVFFFCNIECFVSKQWAETAQILCGCNCDAELVLKQTQLIEGMFVAMKSAAACSQIDVATALLAKLTNLSTFNSCNC